MVGVVVCTEPSVAREAEETVKKGVLVASPSSAVGGRGGRGGRVSSGSSEGGEIVTGLRTPASLLRREEGSGGGGQSGVRTPQKQVGILDYITGLGLYKR